MQVNQRVYYYVDTAIHAGIVEILDIDSGEVRIKDCGWRSLHSVGESPEEAAQKLYEYYGREQRRLRLRIRSMHEELRAINERVAAGPQKPTAEEIEDAHAHLALATTQQAVDAPPQPTNIRHYTGVYENAAG